MTHVHPKAIPNWCPQVNPGEPWTARCVKEKIADDGKRHRCHGMLRCIGEHSVPTPRKPLETNQMRREGRRDIHLTFYWGHGILFPAQHEGRTLHAREGREQVERVILSTRPREPMRDFRMADRALFHRRIARGARVEGEG